MSEEISPETDSWESEFNEKLEESLKGDPDELKAHSYMLTREDMRKLVDEEGEELATDEYQYIIHLLADYASELDPKEKAEKLSRIRHLGSIEKDEEKRKSLGIALKIIEKGNL